MDEPTGHDRPTGLTVHLPALRAAAGRARDAEQEVRSATGRLSATLTGAGPTWPGERSRAAATALAARWAEVGETLAADLANLADALEATAADLAASDAASAAATPVPR